MTGDGIELDVGSGEDARRVGEEFHEAVTRGSVDQGVRRGSATS